jgi:hypothetical protein
MKKIVSFDGAPIAMLTAPELLATELLGSCRTVDRTSGPFAG